MNEPRAPGEALYRVFLRAHPAWFRKRYEAELLACYRDGWRAEAAGRGAWTAARFWSRMAIGVVVTGWRQRAGGTAGVESRNGEGGMGPLIQDLRIGLRTLLRRPGWTAVVVLTLGLGMGATLAVFSVFHAVLLAPLPYPDGDRLVRIYLRNVVNGSERLHLSAPAATELRDLVPSLAAVAVMEGVGPGVDVAGGDHPERIQDLRVDSHYFDALGAKPLAGQFFERAEERADARVAVVTAGLAERHLGGVATAVGRSVVLDGEAHTVIGVVADGFQDPLAGAVDAWLPTDLADDPYGWSNNYLDAFALLAPGASMESARAELEALAERHADLGSAAAEKAFMIFPLKDDLVGSSRPLLLALSGAVAFLLLLTCSNVASLLLARAAARERELAVRRALGSTRAHLVRYFTVETGLVAGAGGLAGLGVGWLALEALLSVAPADLLLSGAVGLGWPNALLAAGLAAGVGSVLGIATALPYSRPTLAPTLADGGRTGQGGRMAGRTRSVLVVTDVALAVVLLVGAGVLLRTMSALQDSDLGIDPEGVVTFDAHLPEASDPTAEERIRFHDELHRRLEALPGVEAAGATSHLPVTGSANTWGTWPVAAPGEPVVGDNIQANQRIAGGHYFQAVGARLVAGRLLDDRDGPDAQRAVVVNRSLVRTLFADDEDPVGRYLRVGPLYPVIVGVVDDIALTARTGAAPMVFHAYDQFGATRRWPMVQVVRGEGGVSAPWEGIRTVLAEVDPNLVMHDPRPLDDVIVSDIGNERFAALLLQTFAALALVLASLGLYGVLAHSVERRRHEIGVRMALGAGRTSVLGMVMRRGLTLMAIGTVLGLAGALALSNVLDFLVFGVSTADPAVFLAVPVLLVCVAALASYLPARHATRVEPATSLEAT